MAMSMGSTAGEPGEGAPRIKNKVENLTERPSLAGAMQFSRAPALPHSGHGCVFRFYEVEVLFP